MEAAVAQRPAAREAQRALAEELTTLVHGADECARAVAASAALFGRGELADLDEATLAAALSETGVVAIHADPLPAVLDVLIATELVDSRSAARRAVVEGGVYINNTKVTDPDAALQTGRPLARAMGRDPPRETVGGGSACRPLKPRWSPGFDRPTRALVSCALFPGGTDADGGRSRASPDRK